MRSLELVIVDIGYKVACEMSLTEEEIFYLRGMIKRDKKMKIDENRQVQLEKEFDAAIRRDMW
jgi:hypothetical protein